MKSKKIVVAFVGIILMISCTNSKELKPKTKILTAQTNTNVRRYAVGKGGGFTGVYEEYILCEDGKVFKYDFIYDREVLTKELSQADLVYFLEKIENLGLEGLSINEPGNMSYYIEIREGNLSINKLLWGSYQYYPPNDVVALHKELFKKLAERE